MGRKARKGRSVSSSEGRSVSSSSEGRFWYLTKDLLLDILSRLPPKSLVTCKSVSKKFHRLVSTLIHSPAEPGPLSGLFIGQIDLLLEEMETYKYFNIVGNGLYLDDEINMEDSLSFLPCDPDARVIDCRDGILLCGNAEPDDGCYVCNPVTKQWVVLPPPPKHGFSSTCNYAVNLALALDGASDVFVSHYKVFLFVTPNDETKDKNDEPIPYLYVHVYSSKTGQWVVSNRYLIGTSVRPLQKRVVFLNGALFLAADPSMFLKFDMEERYISVMNLPTNSDTPEFITSVCFGESQGVLHFAYHNESKMEVWMYEESEWLVKHTIILDDIGFPEPLLDVEVYEVPTDEEPVDLLAFHPNKDAIFLRNQGDFLCYDFTSGALETVMHCDSGTTVSMRYLVFPFTKCLRTLANAHRRI